jgi:hypothetical protein
LLGWQLVDGGPSAEDAEPPSPEREQVGFAVPPPVMAPEARASGPQDTTDESPGRRELPGSRHVEAGADPARLQIPLRGDLRTYAAMRVFYELRIAQFSGKAELWRWGVHHTVLLRHGFVVSGLDTETAKTLAGVGPRSQSGAAAAVEADATAPSSAEPGGLARLFYQRGRIDEALLDQIEALVRERGCSETDALIYSGAVTEWECLAAVQARIEAQLVEVLTWDDGTYKLSAQPQSGDPVQNYVDPIKLIARAVRETIPPEKMLGAFAHIHDRYINPAPRLQAHLPMLHPHFDACDTAAPLDGKSTFAEALQRHDARAGETLGWLYVLWTARLVEPAASPTVAAMPTPAAQAMPPEKSRPLADYSEIARLCELVGKEHARVQGASSADVLGVAIDASASEVLRAHDEATERLSLSSLAEGLPADLRGQAERLADLLAAARDELLAERSKAGDSSDP